MNGAGRRLQTGLEMHHPERSFALPEPAGPAERGPSRPYGQVHPGEGAASPGAATDQSRTVLSPLPEASVSPSAI